MPHDVKSCPVHDRIFIIPCRLPLESFNGRCYSYRTTFFIENHYSMTDPEIRYQKIISKLKERGFRLTSHRLALARLLALSLSHPNASELFETLKRQFPTISLATIYKTLALLKDEREVLEIDWFCNKVKGTPVHCRTDIIHIAICRYDHRFYQRIAFLEPAE